VADTLYMGTIVLHVLMNEASPFSLGSIAVLTPNFFKVAILTP